MGASLRNPRVGENTRSDRPEDDGEIRADHGCCVVDALHSCRNLERACAKLTCEPPRSRASLIVAVDADPRLSQKLRRAIGIRERNKWVKGPAAQPHLNHTGDQWRLRSAGRVDYHSSRCEAPPARWRSCVDRSEERRVGEARISEGGG